MRPRPRLGASSRVERVAREAPALRDLPPPPGLSPLRWRLLRLALDGNNMPDPGRLDALRRMTLREALQLEDVSHHRQREALLLQDALIATPPQATPDFSGLPPLPSAPMPPGVDLGS